MKTILAILCLLTAIAGAKTFQIAFPAALPAQTPVDGMLEKQDNQGKLTLVGPTAKAFFEKLSEARVTSIQPTVECLKVIIKSGDNLDCGHCVERPKQKFNGPAYWCSLNFDMQFGKALINPTFAPSKN